MPSVLMLNVVVLSVAMLNVVIISVFVLNVIVLSVVAPFTLRHAIKIIV